VILLALPAGHLADRRDRRRILLASEALYGVAALGLFALSATRGPVPLFYLFIVVLGMAQAFEGPAGSSLVPAIVPPEQFANAAMWSSSSWQLAAVVGPALGGAIIALSAGSSTPIYALDVAAFAAVVVLLALIRPRPVSRAPREGTTLESLREGLAFLWRTQIILATITLDLFAVLLGGAVTLLPIYATTVLHVGATGLGVMRAAPSIGAVAMAVTLTHLPPFRHAGRTLLLAVAGFGAATIVFGISKVFLVSLLMLIVLGALDNISVVVRSTLILLRTPDELRGRVAAVNSIFVGASNELGGFESGAVAAAIGPVGSVVVGGAGTLVVVGLVALIWPELRRLRGLME
jgi:MFS family permease